MTTPSSFSGKGLSILVSIPLVRGSDVVYSLSNEVISYTHNISSNGGFISCEFTLAGNQEFLESWLDGLARHVKVFNPSQKVIWEGYVNQVDINMGAATFTRGPLTNLANRVSVMYTPLMPKCTDLVADPDCVDDGEPITGTATETYAVEDLISQRKYGIWEKTLNIGEAWSYEAEYARDLHLAEAAYPEGNPSLSISGSEGSLSVKVACRGYIDWLNYVYNDEEHSDSTTVYEIITDILDAEVNGVISPDYSKIKENMVLLDPYTTDNKLAKTLIDDIVTLGGGNDDRWTFGIYGGRVAVYSSIPMDVEYIYYKTGRTQQIETPKHVVVEPWDVVPCKWVAIPTFLTSFGVKIEDVRNDPRVFFAEEVNFTSPDQVTISGAKVRRLSQYLAKLGLGSA